MKFFELAANLEISKRKSSKTMTTDKPNSQNIAATNSPSGESKKELNQKTSLEFSVSLVLGVLFIILAAATAYFGLVR
ncbi:hypothetical protein NIES37_18670 [Tolypothrix tenuis PCC 7101]|uniref:Uncharacterized protein n=1 Tax=Tolypothrix tenuis PCC 7101 TaxID=231146 RepID=A0A1Z4MWT0_9CYAN|nr:hypothetical protein [Aulosira sp. FACHB-113]BAY97919.1 hypothetical protein NIES37_18670 [Tolypothrix tenuis PCC 7101]BAZ71574.1 hypothetical protein NIES50_01170 [Aulosira laxa NIES-50]